MPGHFRRSPAQRPRPPRLAMPPELRGLRVDPRKSLGQHFLVDEDVLARIADLAEAGPGERVVEVGAGLGALTAHLAATGAQVMAVEIDETLCHHLRQRFADKNVSVACTDVLVLPPGDLLALGGIELPYVMVGNLPYYITAPIMRHFLESEASPRRMVVMVQAEVAERMAAKPPRMSLLGVSVQAYAEARVAFPVQPYVFYPPPKVNSAVVQLDLRRHPALPKDVMTFFRVVRAGFSQPRKQLHNALPNGLWMPPDTADELLGEASIDPMRRAGSLSIEEWARLTEVYEAARRDWVGNPDDDD